MTFKTSYNAGLGQPAIEMRGVDTTARVAIGTVLKGYDDLLGEGEFIYLPGVANCNAGDWVIYDLAPGGPSVTRTVAATHANFGQAVAVAVAAVPAGSFGWFQISGCAIGNTVGAAVGSRVFMSSNAGVVTATVVAGAQLIGVRGSSVINAPANGQAYYTLNRPSIQSQIT